MSQLMKNFLGVRQSMTKQFKIGALSHVAWPIFELNERELKRQFIYMKSIFLKFNKSQVFRVGNQVQTSGRIKVRWRRQFQNEEIQFSKGKRRVQKVKNPSKVVINEENRTISVINTCQ